MTYDDVKDEVVTFRGAGFETTGKVGFHIENKQREVNLFPQKVIPGTLLLLAMNPQAQDKLVVEIFSVFSSDDDEVDEENINKMICLNLVLKESLRLIPAALYFAREVNDDVKLSSH